MINNSIWRGSSAVALPVRCGENFILKQQLWGKEDHLGRQRKSKEGS